MALLAFGSLSARHLTPAEALDRLSDKNAPRHVKAAAARATKLLYTAKAADVEQVYVFSNGAHEGYIMLSADDTTPALLAFSDSETFDPANIPDNMQYWLDEYARQINYAAANPSAQAAAPTDVRQRPAVAPKLTTLWDQMSPYNHFTPTHNGLYCPTGCVATALAQVMNWHKWPDKPVGQKSYNAKYVGTLSVNYDNMIPFEWDKMLDRYYVDSPEDNINAVADLMVAIGYACEMNYAYSSSGASGFKAAEGLITHFKYNKSLSLETRSWYNIDEWDDLVYAELTENGPVYYEGSGDGGGHAFVCDGYDDETGLFHFNWGWSGKGNGYYRLSALNPDYQGVGGNSYGYNYQQDIIRGFKKTTESPDEQPTLIFAPYMGVVTPWEEANLGQNVTIKGYETNDGFVNYSIVEVKNVELGARFHNMSTGENIDVLSNNGSKDFAPYNLVNIIGFKVPETLAEGSYNITPIWRTNGGEWREMRTSPQTRNYVPATVQGTKIQFGLGEAEGRAEGKITDAPEYFTTQGDFTIKGSLTATGTGDFCGLVCAVFVQIDDKGSLKIIDQGDVMRVDVRSGETLEFEYTSYPLSKSKLVDGDDYGLVLGNANTGELVSPIYAVKVGNRYGTLQMSAYNYGITGSNFLDPEHVTVKANIKVIAGTYDGPLAVGFSKKKDPFEPERYTVSSDDVHLVAGDDTTVTFSGTIDDVEAGDIYYVNLMYQDANGDWAQLSQYPVTVVISKSYADIDIISADTTEAVYYDTYGRKVTHLTPGNIYIRVLPDGKPTKFIAR